MKKVLFSLLITVACLSSSNAENVKLETSNYAFQECHWQLSDLQLSTGQDVNDSYVVISGTLSYVCNGAPTFQFSGEIKYYYKKSRNSRILTGDYEVLQYAGDELTEEANDFLKTYISQQL